MSLGMRRSKQHLHQYEQFLKPLILYHHRTITHHHITIPSLCYACPLKECESYIHLMREHVVSGADAANGICVPIPHRCIAMSLASTLLV